VIGRSAAATPDRLSKRRARPALADGMSEAESVAAAGAGAAAAAAHGAPASEPKRGQGPEPVAGAGSVKEQDGARPEVRLRGSRHEAVRAQVAEFSRLSR
jgi:hypothetical protein